MVGSLLPQPRRTQSFLDKRGCLVAGVGCQLRLR
jgi:hypothetical protein